MRDQYTRIYSITFIPIIFSRKINLESIEKTPDSCKFQLLYIVHEIRSSFNCNPTIDVRGIILDISKALDKVWHEGLLLKLESYGIESEVLWHEGLLFKLESFGIESEVL